MWTVHRIKPRTCLLWAGSADRRTAMTQWFSTRLTGSIVNENNFQVDSNVEYYNSTDIFDNTDVLNSLSVKDECGRYHVCSSDCEQEGATNNLQNAAVATVTSHCCLSSALLSWQVEQCDCLMLQHETMIIQILLQLFLFIDCVCTKFQNINSNCS